jgi:PAS domain S-box-containing protein
VTELDVFEHAERHELAFERLTTGETIPQMEAELRLPVGGHKPVVVAGQPIEIGEEPCMLFTFMDLEPRRKAESALRQSEQRFQKAFRMLPVPSALLRASDLSILDVNEALCAVTGFSSSDIVGRNEDTPAFLLKDMRRSLRQHLADGGKMHGVDFRIERKNGDTLDCLMSAENVTINQQECLLIAWLDITDRKKLEVELVNAIEVVMKDASWFNKALSEKLANVKRAGSLAVTSNFGSLTKREREVFYALCDGHSDKEIARRLDIAFATVRNHVATIYAKLDVHSRGGALLWARDHGHLRPTAGDPAS